MSVDLAECMHGLVAASCDDCVSLPSRVRGSVWLSGGGDCFHLIEDCPALTSGQEKVRLSGQVPREIKNVSRVWAARDYRLCHVCARYDVRPVFRPITAIPTDDVWVEAADLCSPDEKELLRAIYRRGLSMPVLGADVGDGIPVSMMWEVERVVVCGQLFDGERESIEAAGWTVVEANVDAIVSALREKE